MEVGPNPPDPVYTPASGSVTTFGLMGKRVFQNQPLWGNLPVIPHVNPFGIIYYPGIAGFTGFHILSLSQENLSGYFLGSALTVAIGSEPIDWP
ncbi:MAG: hypothetical protein LUQ50_09635 [Methanospirillum sp.]|uniref:hypothetical protein n=1 Tax=Methanospirillum sp. TaxID=45200 RepID=UPI00236919F9|nr:hypothetical protein [Methanospirillum sp.]MDD1729317.1 hypothetical protein [Methanospirillum sp.]